MNNRQRSVVFGKFKHFWEHCTLHGVYYFYKASSFWSHCMWTVIIGSSVCLCIYLSHKIWIKFVVNPTFTVVESTHYSMDNVIFPAVTVCVSEIVYAPHTEDITRILKLRGYDGEKINMFYRSFNDIKENNYDSDNYIKEMHNILDRLGYTYNILLNKFNKPCHLLIRECVWRSKAIECSRMFRKVLTVMGYCCQFDVKYFRSQVDEDIKFEAGKDVSEALEIAVSTQTISANGSFTDTVAYLYVFDSHNKLTLLDGSITLTAAAYFDVTVAVWAIESSDNFRALSLTERKCFLIEDTMKDADSYQGCITLYLLQQVVTHCRCLPFNYKSQELAVDDVPDCTWERQKCIYSMLGKVQSHIRYIIAEKECYKKCDYVQYETKTAYFIMAMEDKQSYYNLSRVAVHFADNTCIKLRREVLYTWDQMLANLGGIFGLCLGGSIVSLIELLWFLLDLLFSVICPQNKKVRPHKGKAKKLFTSTIVNTENKYPYVN